MWHILMTCYTKISHIHYRSQRVRLILFLSFGSSCDTVILCFWFCIIILMSCATTQYNTSACLHILTWGQWISNYPLTTAQIVAQVINMFSCHNYLDEI